MSNSKTSRRKNSKEESSNPKTFNMKGEGNKGALVLYSSREFTYKEPEAFDIRIVKRVQTEISNAWKDSISIDNKGKLWVSTERLHSILRTDKRNINHIVMKIEEKYKIYANNKTYIRGFKILSIIAKKIEEEGSVKKSMYLNLSKEHYNAINSCEKAILLRLESDNIFMETRKTLKNKRKSKYKIKFDELTGAPLKGVTEFSHIRSVALYKDISDSIENGLVVNKSTHEIITKNGINDEEELKELCLQKGWNLDWYYNFKRCLGISQG